MAFNVKKIQADNGEITVAQANRMLDLAKAMKDVEVNLKFAETDFEALREALMNIATSHERRTLLQWEHDLDPNCDCETCYAFNIIKARYSDGD